jgi:hypothetical protein
MGISGVKTFCDFVAMCAATKEVAAFRVYYCDAYWRRLHSMLHNFVLAALHDLESSGISDDFHAPWRLPDAAVRVERIVMAGDEPHSFVGPSGHVFPWNILLGEAAQEAVAEALVDESEEDIDDAWLLEAVTRAEESLAASAAVAVSAAGRATTGP